MNKNYPLAVMALLCCLLFNNIYAQNVGIGTPSPTAKLEVTGTSSGQGAVLQLTASAGTGHGIRSNIQSAATVSLGNPSAVVGDATNGNGVAGTSTSGTGIYGYTQNGYGVFGTSTSGDAVRGFCTGSGAGGQFYNTSSGPALLIGSGNVGIGVVAPVYKLDASSNLARVASFINTITSTDFCGVFASCKNTPYYGIGIRAEGGYIGIQGYADIVGTGSRIGVDGRGSGGTADNYGLSAYGIGGTVAYGIYASGFGAATNWAGYFAGNVFTSGAYLPSDRKLKNDIREIKDALTIIQQLNPAVYTYKTAEYEQMQLPQGLQYGLIADEVQQVLPGAVTRAVQPAVYSDRNEKGIKLKNEVEFNAVNYTAIIPVLVAAVKEQQSVISSQQKKIDEMEKRLAAVEKE